MSKGNREGVIRLRVHEDFKREVEDIAAHLDISASALARLALREYIAKHKFETMRESSTGYKAELPDKKMRRAIAATSERTSFYVVTRRGTSQ